MGEESVIRPGTAAAFVVPAGRSLRITAVEGRQVATLYAFVKDDPGEFASPATTLDATGRVFPTPGSKLYSNRYEPLMTLVEDEVGYHDLVHPPCRSESFAHFFAQTGAKGCFEAISDAVAPFGCVNPPALPTFNLFMRARVGEDGCFEFLMPEAGPGKGVVLCAAKAIVAAVAACPVELTTVNGGSPSPVRVEIL